MKTKVNKRIFSLVMSIVMVLSLLPAISLKVAAEDSDGTKNSPYRIASYAELENVADKIKKAIAEKKDDVYFQLSGSFAANEGKFNVNSDKTLQYKKPGEEGFTDIGEGIEGLNEWDPINLKDKSVKVHFDGNKKTITGLYVNSGEGPAGLFGYLNAGSEVTNLGLIDGCINGQDQVGSVCGYSEGSVRECHNTGFVVGKSNVGGLVGENGENGELSTNYNTGAVSGNDMVGGLVGNNSGTVQICYNTGNVSGNNKIGGLVGQLGANSTLTESYSIGNVQVSMTGQGGGVVGNDAGAREFSNCYFNVDACQIKNAIGRGSDSTNVKGLTTAQMTGKNTDEKRAGSMDGFDFKGNWSVTGDDTKVSGEQAQYAYYPNLKNNSSERPKIQIYYVSFKGCKDDDSDKDNIQGSMEDQIFYANVRQSLNRGTFACSYSFVCWVSESEKTEYALNEKHVFSANTTLIAKWDKQAPKVEKVFIGGQYAKFYEYTENSKNQKLSKVKCNDLQLAIESSDDIGIKKVEYYVEPFADGSTIKARKDIESGWCSYEKGRTKLNVSDGEYIVYINIIDQADKTTFGFTERISIDTTAPEGKVTIGENEWSSIDFANNVYTTTEDKISFDTTGDGDVANVHYYLGEWSNDCNTQGWAESRSFDVECPEKTAIEPSKGENILVVRFLDSTGNASYVAGKIVKYSEAKVKDGTKDGIMVTKGKECAITINNLEVGNIQKIECKVSNGETVELKKGAAYEAVTASNDTTITLTEDFTNSLPEDKEQIANYTLIISYKASGIVVKSLEVNLKVIQYIAIYNATDSIPENAIQGSAMTLIEFADEVKLSPNVSGKLMENIVLNAGMVTVDDKGNYTYAQKGSETLIEWTPMCTKDKPFNGTFDGDGRTISGLIVGSSDVNKVKTHAGLFAELGKDAVVSKVGIVNSYIRGHEYVGAFAGVNGGRIENCFSMSSVVGASINEDGSVTEATNVGGLVGQNNGFLARSISVGRVVTGGTKNIGGIVGDGMKSTVMWCYYNKEICTGSNGRRLGGISGVDVAGGAEGLTTDKITGDRAKKYMRGLSFGFVWFSQIDNNKGEKFYPTLRKDELQKAEIAEIVKDESDDLKWEVRGSVMIITSQKDVKIKEGTFGSTDLSAVQNVTFNGSEGRITISNLPAALNPVNVIFDGDVVVKESAFAEKDIAYVEINSANITLEAGAFAANKNIVAKIAKGVSKVDLNNNFTFVILSEGASINEESLENMVVLDESMRDVFRVLRVNALSKKDITGDALAGFIGSLNVNDVLLISEGTLKDKVSEDAFDADVLSNTRALVRVDASDELPESFSGVVSLVKPKGREIYASVHLDDCKICIDFYTVDKVENFECSIDGETVDTDPERSSKGFTYGGKLLNYQYRCILGLDQVNSDIKVNFGFKIAEDEMETISFSYSVRTYVYKLAAEGKIDPVLAVYLLGCVSQWCKKPDAYVPLDMQQKIIMAADIEKLQKSSEPLLKFDETKLSKMEIDRLNYGLTIENDGSLKCRLYVEQTKNAKGYLTVDRSKLMQDKINGGFYFEKSISLSDLGSEISFKIERSNNTDTVTVSVSALDYIAAVYYDEESGANPRDRLFMQALYYYYKAATSKQS